ncbi:hypothetical protein [uncultured Olleya sp.]|uniref:hypothetical protein n=1 Tax=uncultured Olleya sp. TaxID=757243 RepID=UPI002594FA20|nr:hypothetical protein [uncultured Olleya sp.]
MKKIKFFLSLILVATFATSCIDDDNDELTGEATEGGLLTLDKTAIGYVVGNGATYTTSGSVYQGNIQTTKIDIYKSFTSPSTGETSNEILYDTVNISNTQIGSEGTFSTSFDYEDLINGLTLASGSLPVSDSSLSIGDYWTLRFVSTLSTGEVVSNATTTKVSVGTRFAGTYRPLDGMYYRIGVLTYTLADWQSFCPETVIESVDASTYRVVEYFGPFNGNTWYFQIDENDNIIYPEETPEGDAQTGNGEPFISCLTHPQELSNVPCGSASNFVERDDVNGADKLYMTFGYLTGNAAGNSREFYQVLEKIVN